MEADRYDYDLMTGENRCKHGTYVGSWAGPDYMCHYCEMGWTDEEFEAACREQERRDRKEKRLVKHIEKLEKQFERVIDKKRKVEPKQDLNRRERKLMMRLLCARHRRRKLRGL